MKILNKLENTITLSFSYAELYMLFMATGGSVFGNMPKRDIPTLANWTKEEALAFEDSIIKIRNRMKNSQIKQADIILSQKELLYLIKIHDDHMEEIDPIEYPTIIGHDWEEAEQLLEDLQKAAALTL